MCQFETPAFILYSYISVIVLSVVIAQCIHYKDPKHPLNRNAFYFLLIIALWTAEDLFQWVSSDIHLRAVLFRMSYLVDFLFPFFIYFSYALVGTALTRKNKIIFALPLTVTIVAVITGYGPGSLDTETCEYRFGWLLYYSLLIDFLYAVWACVILMRKYYHPATHYKLRLQIRMSAFAISVFVLWAFAYEAVDILNTMEVWNIEISPYFILGNLFLIALMTFNIIEYDLFEFDVLPRRWFAFAILSVVFGGMFFFALTPMVALILLFFYAVIMWVFWAR